MRGSRNPPAPTHLTAPVCKHTGAVLFLSAHGAAACSTSSKLRKTEHVSQTYHKKVTNRLFPLKKIVKRLFIWYHIGVAGKLCRSARRNESRSRRSIHEEKERSGFAAPGRCDVPDRMRRQRILHQRSRRRVRQLYRHGQGHGRCVRHPDPDGQRHYRLHRQGRRGDPRHWLGGH